jgi:hypothetical protein
MMQSPEDTIVEAVTAAAQATVGPLAAAHPWLAGTALVMVSGMMMLGLVSGFISPDNLNTPRKRAFARIALRLGLAMKGSLADMRAFANNVDPPTNDAPAPDPLAVAASSLPEAPVPAALVAQARALAPHPATVAATTPREPGPPLSREDPRTVPPPRPRSQSAPDSIPTSRDLPPRGRDRGRS